MKTFLNNCRIIILSIVLNPILLSVFADEINQLNVTKNMIVGNQDKGDDFPGPVRLAGGLFDNVKRGQFVDQTITHSLHEDWLLPLIKGNVVQFKFQSPTSFKNLKLRQSLQSDDKFENFIKSYDIKNIVGFEVEATINPLWRSGLLNFVKNNSTRSVAISGNVNREIHQFSLQTSSLNKDDVFFTIKNKKLGSSIRETYSVYKIENSKSDLMKRSVWATALVSGASNGFWDGSYYTFYDRHPTPANNFVIEFYDQNNIVIQRELVTYKGEDQGRVFGDSAAIVFDSVDPAYNSPFFTTPWSMLGMATSGGGFASPVVRDDHSFMILVFVEPSTMERAKGVNLRVIR